MNRAGRGRGFAGAGYSGNGGGGGRGYSGNGGGGRGYSGGGGGGRGGAGRYTNPCLTMHQPWASLLVYGIKRIEGRSWPSPITGRLWIHAASKVPDQETIKAMEDFYREIYAINGVTDIQFPEHYPVSRLIGCVEVVGCLKCEELVSWEAVPESVRLEGLTDFCWLCENPQKLLIPFEMRGNQGVYNLEKRVFESAVRGLSPMRGPLPVRFPLPVPTDHFSLYPGSLSLSSPYQSNPSSLTGTVQQTARVSSAIAGAKAAASQYLKNNNNNNNNSSNNNNNNYNSNHINDYYKVIEGPSVENNSKIDGPTGEGNVGTRKSNLQIGASNNRLFAAAFGSLKLNDAP